MRDDRQNLEIFLSITRGYCNLQLEFCPQMSDTKKYPTLVWLDLEMTGLEPDSERIIEIATAVTNHDLSEIIEGNLDDLITPLTADEEAKKLTELSNE